MLQTFLALSILIIALAAPLAISAQTETPFPTTKAPYKAHREAILEKKDELKTSVLEKRQAAKERAQTKRETFKQNLSLIRDTKKQAIVQRIDEKMATVNDTKTTKMSEAIDRLSELLAKIKSKAAELKLAGSDTTSVDTAVTEAESKIAAAKTAIGLQAEKEYVLTVTDETTLRTTVGQSVSQMHKDLKATHETVTAAKKAVKDGAQELRKVIDPSAKTITPTP